MKKTAFFCLLAVFFSSETSTQEIQEYSDPYQLMNMVVKKARENDGKKRESLRFTKTYMVHKLNNAGNLEYEKTGERETKREGKGQKTEPQPIDINQVLATNYHFRFDDNKIQRLIDENGQTVCASCYVIRFWPKDNLPDGKNPYYEAANRLTGKIYVDKEHLYLRRLSAEMNRSFNVAVILGRIREVKILFEQELRRDLDDIVVIKHFTITSIRYRRIFSERFERHAYIYSNYELVR